MRSWMIGLVIGIASVAGWPWLPPLYVLALAALPAVLPLRAPSPLVNLASGLACGCCVGLLHGHALLASRLDEPCSGKLATVTGTIASLPERDEMQDGAVRQRFDLVTRHIEPLACRGPRKISISYYGPETMVAGEHWRFEAVLKRPWGLANPGTFNAQGWFARRGIDAVGSVPTRGLATQLPDAAGLRYHHHSLRQAVGEAIDALPVGVDARGILRALTIGDKSSLDYRLWSLFQQFGINHLLVVSGLHVGLMAGLGFLLGKLLMRVFPARMVWGVALPAICGLGLALAYALLAGFSLPTQRVLCMLLPFAVAPVLGRQSKPAGNLLLAAAMVLVLNPLATTGSGFWLSFGAVGALLWLAVWQKRHGRVRNLLGTHLYMSLVMLPLGGWFFAGGSLVAMLANLVMIPLIGLYVVPLALLAAFAHLLALPLAEQLWLLAIWPVARLLSPAEALALAANGVVYAPLQSSALPLVLAGLGALLWAMPLSIRDRTLSAALFLPLVLVPSDALPTLRKAPLRVTVLDVGQGTAVVVRAGARALVYDTGGGGAGRRSLAAGIVIPYLRAAGVQKLDALVISHADMDHSAGMRDMLNSFPVERVRYGGESVVSPRVGLPCVAGESWRWPGGAVLRFLSPARENGLSSNNSSCVLQIIHGELRMLLPGDIDTQRERELVRFWPGELAADLLLVGHHGSNTSTSYALLKQVRPHSALVSSGYKNRFGHPHPAVVRRLEAMGLAAYAGKTQEIVATAVLNTALTGAQEFVLDPGGSLERRLWRESRRRYWM
mgnify:FL=1